MLGKTEAAPAGNTAEQATRTVRYLDKEYTVPAKVERIVITGSLEAMEDAGVLGVQPVGGITIGGKFPDMFKEITGSTVSIGEKTQPNFETILQLKPDLGGLISMYAAYLYPGVFGKIGSISGSFWYEGFVDYMREQKMAQTGLRLYLDVGSLEGDGKQTVQREMVARTKEAYAILAASGLNGKLLRLHVEQGGRHELSCFRSRFPQALTWLFQT